MSETAIAATASPLRDKMAKKVAYWKSLRELTDEQQAALEFWEAYLQRDPATLGHCATDPNRCERTIAAPINQPNPKERTL